MSIYVNRMLNFKRIQVVGFDMDYTLVEYNTNAFEKLVHSMACKRLVEQYSSPESVANLDFDRKRAIVGLVIDKKHGNLLKLSRFGKVKIAYKGTEEIDFRIRSKLYRKRVIDLNDPDFESLDTAFSISYGVLFSQVVQLKKSKPDLPDFRQIAEDVNKAINSIHTDGTLKSYLLDNLEEYVIRNDKIAAMLEQLKSYGKKLMIITNSDYHYSDALLDYSLTPYLKKHKNWKELFDLVITLADKPRFFELPGRFLKIDPEKGTMTNHLGPVSNGLWQGGWFRDVQDGLQVPGDEILYLGDHIFGDVVSIKKQCDWRTALVLNGLKEELQAIQSAHTLQIEIDSLMIEKNRLEKLSNDAEMQRRKNSKHTFDPKLASKQEHLNLHISELVEKLRSHFNPYWGEIFRAGSEESRYAEQVEKYACIYMTQVSDLYDYSPRTYFRPIRRLSAHEHFA